MRPSRFSQKSNNFVYKGINHVNVLNVGAYMKTVFSGKTGKVCLRFKPRHQNCDCFSLLIKMQCSKLPDG